VAPDIRAAAPAFRRLPRAVREQQMLDAAVRVFSQRGYHAASVDEIAETAGISKPMVYAYLGTKEELFRACLHREGVRLIEALASAGGGDLPPDEQFWRGLRAFFTFVDSHRDGWIVLYRQARGQEPFGGIIIELRARMVEIVPGCCRESVRRRGLKVGDGRCIDDGTRAGGRRGGVGRLGGDPSRRGSRPGRDQADERGLDRCRRVVAGRTLALIVLQPRR
jgi:AcrR family transcriptional regulator